MHSGITYAQRHCILLEPGQIFVQIFRQAESVKRSDCLHKERVSGCQCATATKDQNCITITFISQKCGINTCQICLRKQFHSSASRDRGFQLLIQVIAYEQLNGPLGMPLS